MLTPLPSSQSHIWIRILTTTNTFTVFIIVHLEADLSDLMADLSYGYGRFNAAQCKPSGWSPSVVSDMRTSFVYCLLLSLTHDRLASDAWSPRRSGEVKRTSRGHGLHTCAFCSFRGQSYQLFYTYVHDFYLIFRNRKLGEGNWQSYQPNFQKHSKYIKRKRRKACTS